MQPIISTVSSTGKVIAVAGLMLVGAGLWAAQSPGPCGYRLVLDAASDPRAVYFSRLADGPMAIAHDASDGKDIVNVVRFDWEDGCTWEATEVLHPISARQYSYTYDERLISCTDGAVAAQPTPRTGVVNVLPIF